LARQDEPNTAECEHPQGDASVMHEGLALAGCDDRASLLKRLWREQVGATTLEYGLLLAAIALPSYVIFRQALLLLVFQYRMIVELNSLPFP
jgi:hypothetical protein